MGCKGIKLEGNGNEIELGPWSMFKVQATHNAPPKDERKNSAATAVMNNRQLRERPTAL